MKIGVVLYQNTISDLTESYNGSAITPFHCYKENKTQWGFLLGACGFLSLLSCNVEFTVSLKVPGTCLDSPDHSPAWWVGQSLLNSCHSAGAAVCCQQSHKWRAQERNQGQKRFAPAWWDSREGCGWWAVATTVRKDGCKCWWLNTTRAAGAAPAPGPGGLQPCPCSRALEERTSRITKDDFKHVSLGFFFLLCAWDYSEHSLNPRCPLLILK